MILEQILNTFGINFAVSQRATIRLLLYTNISRLYCDGKNRCWSW